MRDRASPLSHSLSVRSYPIKQQMHTQLLTCGQIIGPLRKGTEREGSAPLGLTEVANSVIGSHVLTESQFMTQEMIADSFRQAMRRLATTIAVVTTGTRDNWVGMAATAVTSVTADPPTILVAANMRASMIPILEQEGLFCVNLLSERHCELVRAFSGALKGADRFRVGNWHASDEGLPVLADAVSSLICEIKSTVDVGTHRLLIGEVRSVINHPQIDPLIWIDSGFASAARLPERLQTA